MENCDDISGVKNSKFLEMDFDEKLKIKEIVSKVINDMILVKLAKDFINPEELEKCLTELQKAFKPESGIDKVIYDFKISMQNINKYFKE